MRRTRIITLVAIVVSVITGSIAAVPAGAHGRRAPTPPTQVTLLADGLQGSVGATIGPDGALYVPEAELGRITRIDPATGNATTFASGLPPQVIPLGGAIDVAFVGATMYVLVTVVGPDVGGNSVVGIYRLNGSGAFTVFADLGTWSIDHPPATAFDLPDGVQFALQPVADGFLVIGRTPQPGPPRVVDGGDHSADPVPEHRPHGAGGDPRHGLPGPGGPDPSCPGDGEGRLVPVERSPGRSLTGSRPDTACSSTSSPVRTGRSTRSRRVTRRATSPRRARRHRIAASCSWSTGTVRSPSWSTSWTCQPRSISLVIPRSSPR